MKLKRKRNVKKIICSSDDSNTIGEEDPIEDIDEKSIITSTSKPLRKLEHLPTLLDKYCPKVTVSLY